MDCNKCSISGLPQKNKEQKYAQFGPSRITEVGNVIRIDDTTGTTMKGSINVIDSNVASPRYSPRLNR